MTGLQNSIVVDDIGTVSRVNHRGGGGVGGGVKALLQPANFTLGPDATRNTEIHKNAVRIKVPNSVNA